MSEIRYINGTVLYTAQDATDVRSALQEANLDGAATGCLLGYGWSLHRGRFRYGCEDHELGCWTESFIEDRCQHHVGINAAKYAAALKGLVAWLRTLELEVTP